MQRGFLDGFLDRLASWIVGLEAETSAYDVSQNIEIPMRDSVHLAATLYRPHTEPNIAEPAPMLLVQGCYGRGVAMSILNARLYAARGYIVLFVSSRGTFGSGGQFVPGQGEKNDGQDVVAWMREQPWYPGRFATVGASYLGYSQWALLYDPPDDWCGAAIAAAPHDYAQNNWGTGSFRLDRIIWSDMIAHQEDTGFRLSLPKSRLETDKALAESVFLGLPLRESVRTYFGADAPWLDNTLAHPNLEDPFWKSTRHAAALDQVSKPILLVGGWYDLFFEQTMAQYYHLRDRGSMVKLIVGPWAHMGAAGPMRMPAVLDFLEEHVAGRRKQSETDPVQIFVTGADKWQSMSSWPPATKSITWYLQEDSTIGMEAPPADATSSSFTFNPAKPTPTIGGPLLKNGGQFDDSAYSARSDVLVYTSSPLEEDVEIRGRPILELTHSSDVPHIDLFVRLSEVNVSGVSHNITEQFQAMTPTRSQPAGVKLEMLDCAHRFSKGTSMRIIIAGGSFPHYAPSLGIDGNRTTGSVSQSAEHSVSHAQGSSKLTIPVLPP